MYSGSEENFRIAVEGCFVPLLTLGGKLREGKSRDVLEEVWGAIQAGGHGVVMGRNIWSHPHPDQVTRALSVIIHGGGTVDQAMEHLE
jgi:DhnA family fructose-bisphosphate aldolase class Ia